MNAKKLLGIVLASLISTLPVAAQDYDPVPAPLLVDSHPLPSTAGTLGPPSTGLSDWIKFGTQHQAPLSDGSGRPISWELYLRSGASFPVGGNFLGRELQTGWSIMGGGRALFFNHDYTKAFTVDAHIINTYQSSDSTAEVPLSVFLEGFLGGQQRLNFGSGGIPGVTVRGYNRTMAGLGFGREWYLVEPANCAGNHWRWGADLGGRYGSCKMDFNEIPHRTDVIGGVYGALHTDFEIAHGRFVYLAGVRTEWAYTFGDVLQRQSDIQDLNLLITLGVRY